MKEKNNIERVRTITITINDASSNKLDDIKTYERLVRTEFPNLGQIEIEVSDNCIGTQRRYADKKTIMKEKIYAFFKCLKNAATKHKFLYNSHWDVRESYMQNNGYKKNI